MRFWAGMLCFFMLGFGHAQNCDLSISVPDDVTLCGPDAVLLDGNINGSYYAYEWTGSNGFYNNTSLTPVINVTENTTFTLRAFGDPQTNLIQNGDFEDGNTDFSTQYTYNPVSLWAEGTYTVTNNPNSVHSGFAACTAQSQNQMMVLNGAPSLAQVWCQSVPVQPNTLYVFWAWAASVNSSNPARLQFSINGNLLGPQMVLTNSLCVWQQFYTTWFSGSQTNADICIVNQNTVLSGNDFAIDNLFFGPLCEDEASFDVVIEEFEVLPQFPDVIDCYFFEQIIEAQTSPPLYNATYEWSTQDGIINSNPTDPLIYAAAGGVYRVTVTSINGCTSTGEFLVEENLHEPDIRIAGNPVIDCYAAQADLFAYEYQGIPCRFTWKTPTGQKIQGASLLASTPGIYEVVGIGENGCESITTIEVSLDENTFEYEVPPPGAFSCLVDSIHLSVLLGIPVDTITWSVGKSTRNPGPTDSILITQPGTYYFTLYKGAYCKLSDSIHVELLNGNPGYEINNPDTITCAHPTSSFVLSHLQNIQSYLWIKDSTSLGQHDTLFVSKSGDYILVIIDSLGCTTKDTLQVQEDKAQVNYSVQIDSIDCLTGKGRFLLNATSFIDLHWKGQGGESQDPNPEFDKEGLYHLTLTGTNGCTTSDSFYLPSSIEFPIVSVISDTITCIQSYAQVNIVSSSDVNIQWTGPGNVSGTSTQFLAYAGGIYSLEAQNLKGCITSKNFEIEVDTTSPSLQLTGPVLIDCNQPSFYPSYTTGDFTTLNWLYNGNYLTTQHLPLISSAGEYTLQIWNKNGCMNQAALIVKEDFIRPDITLNFNNLDCRKPFTEVTVSAQQVAEYFLNGLPVDSTFVITEPGQFVFYASNSNGCDTSFNFEVTGDFVKHLPLLDTVVLNCYNPEKIIKDNNFNAAVEYQWEYNGTFISGDSILITENADVFLHATSPNGCDTAVALVIKVDKNIPEAHIEGNPEIKCNENFSALTFLGNQQIKWFWIWDDQTIEGDTTLVVKKPGLCLLRVVNPSNGCTQSDSVFVSKQPEPEELVFQFQPPLCPEDNGVLLLKSVYGGTAPHDIYFKGQKYKTGSPIDIIEEGQHQLSVSDKNGCLLDTSFLMIRRPDFKVNAGKDTSILWGQSIGLTPYSDLSLDSLSFITWSPKVGLDCGDCFAPMCTPEVNTHYTLTIVDQYGCVRSDDVEIRVLALKGFDAPNIIHPGRENNHRFTLYSLYNSLSTIQELKIYDRWGTQLFHKQHLTPGDISEGWDGTFQGKQVIPGVFIWVAKLEFRDGSVQIASGDITVLSD